MGRLLAHFGSVEAILAADAVALQQVSGVGKKIAASICTLDVLQIEREMQTWQAAGVYLILSQSITYPSRLLKLEDEPPTLFTRGTMIAPSLWGRTVGVVGTRTPTPRAAGMALTIGAQLARHQITVVSGMALGIDAQAHRGALSMQQGLTLAVLGGGVLNIYPSEHTALAQQIMESGALFSENHPFATATASRLVARNRLIAALSDALIVVETSARGGAMYAARAAQSLNKPIYTFALPADGNQALLQAGAIALSDDLRELLENPK